MNAKRIYTKEGVIFADEDEANKIAKANADAETEGWVYHVTSELNFDGSLIGYIIEIYDEDGQFIGKL